MTIKELEQRVNMPRTNIRFYEQEGLLSPARHPNGYRDYSEADVETLEKIRLLRRLHLDLDTIRALQSGEISLPDALSDQLTALETDRDALTGAVAVCRRLREEGTGYAALQPQPWLEELDRAPTSERFTLPEDRLPPPAGHPWRRYFARSFDLLLYGLPLVLLERLVLHMSLSALTNNWFILLDSYLAIGLMFLIEPFLLHRWGTTPGKALFGIRLQDRDGEYPSVALARHRLWLVFSKGMGYGIPFYEIYRNYRSYVSCRDGERLAWEGSLPFREEEPAMTVPDGLTPWVRYAAARLACLGLTILIGLQSWIPPHQGALSEEEFYENWNFYAALTEASSWRLDTDGRPVKQENVFYVLDPVSSRQWIPIYEGDTLVGARFVLEIVSQPGDEILFAGGYGDTVAGLLAWVGGQEHINCLNFSPRNWVRQIPERQQEYQFTRNGVQVSQRIELTNLAFLSGSDMAVYKVADPDLTGRFHLEFTVKNA